MKENLTNILGNDGSMINPLFGKTYIGTVDRVDRRIPLHGMTERRKSLLSPSQFVEYELAAAGVKINGSRDYDIQIATNKLLTDLAVRGSLGLGESYMKGEWTSRRVDLFVEKLFRSSAARHRKTPVTIFNAIRAKLFNLQSKKRSRIVCDKHYDIGNDLFSKMLDERMVYTCGYWKDARTLEEAQIAKMDLICRKLNLRPGMKILDIGCGFGSLMKYAAEKYGVSCVGYSLSQEQITYGRESCIGLPIEFVFDDYRNIRGVYDRVVSVGMMEAVGHKNFRNYMEVINLALKSDGYAVIHTVGHNLTTTVTDPWVDKYIFPNGILPSISQIGQAIEGLFVMEDWHNFGQDYNKTLLAWNERFQAAWPELKTNYSEEFKRMWEFYLLSFAGGFEARNWQLWQIVLNKKGNSQPPCRQQ